MQRMPRADGLRQAAVGSLPVRCRKANLREMPGALLPTGPPGTDQGCDAVRGPLDALGTSVAERAPSVGWMVQAARGKKHIFKVTLSNQCMRRTSVLLTMVVIVLLTPNRVWAQLEEPYEKPPFNYSSAKPHDAMAELETRSGASLPWTGGGKVILQRLLKELHVPVESQVLVFSKTSFQRQVINPKRPRALYFSDTAYVGWVPDGLIEVTTIDPQLGPIFYSFDPNAEQPRFARDSTCMTCHGGQFVRGIPGLLVRSMFVDATGEPLFRYGSEVVDFRTPFTNRWGGWYVTGKHGDTVHRGNAIAHEKNDELVVD